MGQGRHGMPERQRTPRRHRFHSRRPPEGRQNRSGSQLDAGTATGRGLAAIRGPFVLVRRLDGLRSRRVMFRAAACRGRRFGGSLHSAATRHVRSRHPGAGPVQDEAQAEEEAKQHGTGGHAATLPGRVAGGGSGSVNAGATERLPTQLMCVPPIWPEPQ